MPDEKDLKSIFGRAIEIEAPDERTRFLDEACSNHPDLRAQLEELLRSHEHESAFMDRPAIGPGPTLDHSSVTERPGQQIGRYKLLQVIGEGGFGVVYMAEQTSPVHRKVALKIIKPGMDTRAVVARFEAERQTLALMDHPNIARVLDGGTTDSGRPYFVMDLVQGVPITTYCDDNKLATCERLSLFIDVCHAVQHAHRKAIIHRDLKPANILVTLHDGKPVVKVIDFGVSKAINQQLTEKTLFTAYGQMVGTPQYMSPEQAEMSGLDIDTRSDVYSLGVLLYELLVGTPPILVERLTSAGYTEIQRLIKEEEPPRPSTRLSSSGDRLTHLAEHRSISAEGLHREISGDLDWIVMKALEKDRTRRYESPDRFAEDVIAYMQNDIVLARPPSVGYRLRKFLRRNKTLVGTAGVVAFALLVGLVGTALQLDRALRAERLAQERLTEAEEARDRESKQRAKFEEAVKKWRLEIIDRGIEAAMRGDPEAVRGILVRAEPAQVPQHWRLLLQGLAKQYGGQASEAKADFMRAQKLAPESVAVTAALAMSMINREIEQDRWQDLMLKVRDMHATGEYEAYDQLFKGWALVYDDPAKAADLIRLALSSGQRWPIGQAMLAQALAHQAQDEQDPHVAREALQSIRNAERATPDSPFIRVMGVWVRVVAFDLDVERELMREEGNRLAEKIRSGVDFWQGQAVLAEYYAIVEPELAIPVFRSLDEDWFGACRAAFFLERNEIDEALRGFAANRSRTPLATIGQACVKAENGDISEAIQTYDMIKDRYRSWLVRVHALELLLHARNLNRAKSEAQELLNEIRDDKRIFYDAYFFRFRERIQFIAEELPQEKFLAKVDNSAIGKTYAHYLIGLKLRANGDDAAWAHFRKAVDAGFFGSPQYFMSKAILTRQRTSEGV